MHKADQTALLERAAQAHLAVAQATALYENALVERRRALQAAHKAGNTMQKIGEVAGMSTPRVQRVISGNAPKRPRRSVPVEL